MRLLTSPSEIDLVITDLIKRYKYYDWMSAWAGIGFSSYKALMRHQSRCRKVIIGTHFFQTHPEFIEAMRENKGIRFVKQTNELFHPKTYLFYNDDADWQILTGSANFTKGAFTSNAELMLWVSSEDEGSKQVLDVFQDIVSRWWRNASHFTLPELEKYRRAWRDSAAKKASLAHAYGGKALSKSNPLDVRILTMTWTEYMQRLKEGGTDIELRVALLNHIREQFEAHNSFSQIPVELRKFIAGVQNNHDSGLQADFKPWMAFGNMSGSGYFANRVIANDEGIWQAIDCIPLTGQVTRDDYMDFAYRFKKLFSDKSVGTATRLLAMKRPDVFYCLTSANKRRFCNDFGLVYSHITLLTYWDIVVMPIQDSDWWLHPEPVNKIEFSIKGGRAAFLDSIYYKE